MRTSVGRDREHINGGHARPADRRTTKSLPHGGEARQDPRYKSRRWQRRRLAVLRRDNWVCRIVVGCLVQATVADHIIPVYLGMPNDLFFAMDNLRAGCRDHNLARAGAAKLEGGIEPDSDVVVRDYS